MGQNKSYVNDLLFKVDLHYQPVVVALNIEHDAVANMVRVRERRAKIREALPVRLERNPIPSEQRNSRGRVLVCEFLNLPISGDFH
jgi:hypothetical protein